VERHEHFESLAASASLGEATGAELAELSEHLRECPGCREAYANFLSYGAVRVLEGQEEISGAEAIECIDSALFRESFLKKAEAEGILNSRVRAAGILPGPAVRRTDNSNTWRFALAAALLLIAAGVVGLRGHKLRGGNASSVAAVAEVSPTFAAPPASPPKANETALSRLVADNGRLSTEVASLKASLAKEAAAVEEHNADAQNSQKERATLLAETRERDARIADLERQLAQAQTEAESVRAELQSAEMKNQTALAANETKIRDLSGQVEEQLAALERENQMLSANRDIRDLMSARNLHIADVFDTDTKGRTRPAFGRVFFTEGKSLLIYAYDLNDKRVEEAGYHYRVWGKKEGPGPSTRSLGIFYSDDKAQKRWVFKCEDPKVLSQIDSVFVTLEPPGKDSAEPKGEKFLYAYLRNQPNHP
jgi:hypothetical protein